MGEMIQENELVTLIIGIGILIFLLVNFRGMRNIPGIKILAAGFCMLFSGWIFTILEGFFFKNVLNLMEHICYAVSSILVVVWCWRVIGRKEEER